MKLKLISSVSRSDSESWSMLAVLEVVQGETMEKYLERVTPADHDVDEDDVREWERQVLVAAGECGLNIQPESSGRRFANSPEIEEFTRAHASITVDHYLLARDGVLMRPDDAEALARRHHHRCADDMVHAVLRTGPVLDPYDRHTITIKQTGGVDV